MHRSITALAAATAVAIPFAAANPFFPINVTATHAAAAVAMRTIKGPSVPMQWGPVQVTIVVKGKHVSDVLAVFPSERPRSAYINKQAIPYLRSEVLKAQSANIDLISGATMTSEAFDASLQAALKTAKL